MEELKTPPNNTEAERALLGAVLVDTIGRSGDRVMDLCLTSGISVESFYDPRNRVIYSAMLAINRASKPLDPVSLIEELTTTGKIEIIGGAGYLQSLIEQVPTAAHAEHYLNIVLAKQLRRTLIERASKVVEKSYDEKGYPDPRVVLGEAEKSFLEIDGGHDKTMPWNVAVKDSFKKIERFFDDESRKSLEGLSTGLVHLDEKLQGLKPSEMIVIAARPSVGKTSLAMNIAESVAMGEMLGFESEGCSKSTPDGGKQHPVAIFSLEMPVEALTQRMVAGRARINLWRLKRGLCHKDERAALFNNLTLAADGIASAPIYVDDTAALDVMDMRARARRMKKQHGIELIVIDYLQLCCCREGARQSRQIEVSMISQQIKAMAKELKIPVIVLSQLSRANEQRNDKNERPKLSDLRDSGAIEQDADVVFLLRRPSRTPGAKDADDEKLAIIDVAKNRNGETGEVNVDFVRELTRFFDRHLMLKEPEGFESSEMMPEQSNMNFDPGSVIS